MDYTVLVKLSFNACLMGGSRRVSEEKLFSSKYLDPARGNFTRLLSRAFSTPESSPQDSLLLNINNTRKFCPSRLIRNLLNLYTSSSPPNRQITTMSNNSRNADNGSTAGAGGQPGTTNAANATQQSQAQKRLQRLQAAAPFLYPPMLGNGRRGAISGPSNQDPPGWTSNTGARN